MVELDDVGVIEELHHLHLPHDLFQIRLVQLALVDDLDGNLKIEKKYQMSDELSFFFGTMNDRTVAFMLLSLF